MALIALFPLTFQKKKYIFFGHLDQYLSLPKIKKYDVHLSAIFRINLRDICTKFHAFIKI